MIKKNAYRYEWIYAHTGHDGRRHRASQLVRIFGLEGMDREEIGYSFKKLQDISDSSYEMLRCSRQKFMAG